MVQSLKVLNFKKINTYIHHRKGEKKFGEKIRTIDPNQSLEEQLLNSKASYVFLGIEEDIGIQANYGIPGAKKSWELALKSLLNIQQNEYNKGGKLLVLGYLNFENEYKTMLALKKANKIAIDELRKLVESIDREVTYYVSLIVRAGKIPIIVGGGHNNTYGIIKGCSLAINKPIHAINFDAHTRFQPMEGRHSGNGFSFAFYEGFLKKYYVLGVHKNYTSKKIFNAFEQSSNQIAYSLFEDIEVKATTNLTKETTRALKFVGTQAFGVEVDCDAIANFPCNTRNPSGFTISQVRTFIFNCGARKNAAYLHLCGASAYDANSDKQVGKLLADLISDFIKL